MPKIIKSMKDETIYNSAPMYFQEAENIPYFNNSDSTVIALADDGFIYEIAIVNGNDDWAAMKYTSNPNAKNKTNIYEMLLDAKFTEQMSQRFRTKKELVAALEAGVIQWENYPVLDGNKNSNIKIKFEIVEEENNDQPPIPNSQLKDNDKKAARAEVEYLSPFQKVSRNDNFVTIKNNFVYSENKKSEPSFPFNFLRVLVGRIWIFISVTTFVFNFGQVFLCSKFEPKGFLFLIFTYYLSVWVVNADKSNNRSPSFSYFLIPRGKLNKIIFYTALSLAILSIFGAASDMNSFCQFSNRELILL